MYSELNVLQIKQLFVVKVLRSFCIGNGNNVPFKTKQMEHNLNKLYKAKLIFVDSSLVLCLKYYNQLFHNLKELQTIRLFCAMLMFPQRI